MPQKFVLNPQNIFSEIFPVKQLVRSAEDGQLDEKWFGETLDKLPAALRLENESGSGDLCSCVTWLEPEPWNSERYGGKQARYDGDLLEFVCNWNFSNKIIFL